MSYFMSVVGVVLIFEGIPWFLSPARTKKLLAQIHALSDDMLRIMGLLAMLAGLTLVWLS